jgi:hypothetical protein
MTTDTPRTDAARERYYDGKPSEWVHYTICRLIEKELAASQAEVIGEALSSELYFPDFVNELNAFKASLSSPSSL